ncbi:protein-methionine-sulfoxide reductase catalytic subunit MsrP [Tepidicaulis sp. LMO-SS28]|uniref:protein-methionine-sulfoxide reductase catalytic subunit MsrP n=1 Tax=Tepidicaulis sp. LMO-SS28 TaxID=3447455 RepID=UPI003EE143A8
MLIKSRKIWDISEAEITPPEVFFNRRRFLKSSGLAMAGIAAFGLGACDGEAADNAAEADPTADLYPLTRNDAFKVKRDITPKRLTSTYNNFYEFGSHKRIYDRAQELQTRPWQVVVDGDVNNPMTLDIDELIRSMPLEERVYRHRCVEAWSMVVPWTGFPLKEIVKRADPKSGTRYVRMETFLDPDVAPGQRQYWYPWPYVEGLTLEEASNDLAFMVTGVYGAPLLKQYGAPLRLAVPWKYGFKSIKSVVRFTFTAKRPMSFWEEVGPQEYGFWANVNPEVPHPRWSQATEEVLGTGKRVPTQLFNGYGEQVAEIYKGMEKQPLWM